jgi:hypothetical protein
LGFALRFISEQLRSTKISISGMTHPGSLWPWELLYWVLCSGQELSNGNFHGSRSGIESETKRTQVVNNRFEIFRMGVSEYPLKRNYNFKGLSVRPSIGYPLTRIGLRGSSTAWFQRHPGPSMSPACYLESHLVRTFHHQSVPLRHLCIPCYP